MSYRQKLDWLVISGASLLAGVIAIVASSWSLFWFLGLVISLAAAHLGALPLGNKRDTRVRR